MTEVDFYILQSDTLAARDHFACRLIEKATGIGRQVMVMVEDKNHAQSMSHYLWSFKPESFIPHSIIDEDEHSPKDSTLPKVLISWKEPDTQCHDVLINLSREVPEGFSRFQKLSEIVVQDPLLLSVTRSHFTFYRERGYPLKSHKM